MSLFWLILFGFLSLNNLLTQIYHITIAIAINIAIVIALMLPLISHIVVEWLSQIILMKLSNVVSLCFIIQIYIFNC